MVDYSLTKAKFWLLFPAAVKTKPNPLMVLSEEALKNQVDAAVHSMVGYKKEEQAKIISHIQYFIGYREGNEIENR